MLTNSNELLGQTLGTCTLQRLLGRGGMGAVYLAQQSRPRRIVAVKVLLPGIVEQRPREEFLLRFRREADAIAALDHINIMPIYEYGEQGETAYLVMPYVTGGTLRERLEKRGMLPLPEVVQIIEEAAAGLDSAHAQGIIHRDLKPANMLFHADGRLLLADFGLAKVLKEATEGDSGLSVLTSAGTIVGTPEYLSPEQGTGSTLDVRTDLYSLGVVLYQMLTGRVPFTGSSPVAIAIKHALEEPPPPTQLQPSLPRSVEAVVLKALAKAPDERFSSAGELASALRHALDNTRVTQLWEFTPSELVTPKPLEPKAAVADEPTANILAERTLASEDGHHTQSTQQEQLPTLPTLRTKESADDLHTAPTQESHRLPPNDTPVVNPPVVVTPAGVTIADPPQPPARYPRNNQQYEQNEPAERAVMVQQQRVYPVPARSNASPFWRILIGSLLVLLLLGGSFATYLHFKPSSASPTGRGDHRTRTVPTHTPIIQQNQQTPQATATQQTTPQPLALPTPPPAVAVGPLLYETDAPAKCDKQGGQWSKTDNARIACTPDGAELTNVGSGNLAGTFLDQMPGKSMPNDFVLQVQVTVNPGSSGRFGIYFRNQSGAQFQGAYTLMIDQATATWTANVYDNKTGKEEALNSPATIAASLQQTLTIDILVRGNYYQFYFNGNGEGDYAISGGQYPSGNIGLATGPGADVTFKNLEIYALP